MELFHHKKETPLQYVEWFVSDEESDDNWMGYLNHSITGTPGGELPFPDSEWTFTNHNTDKLVYNLAHKALYDDPKIDSTNIKITVLNGNLSLTGTVQNANEIWLAEIAVRKIKDVWSVKNQLNVEEKKGNFRSPLNVIS